VRKAAFPGPLVLIQGAADAFVPTGIADAVIAWRIGLTHVVRSGADQLGTWQATPDAALAAMQAVQGELGL
jgi:hypothetical protein